LWPLIAILGAVVVLFAAFKIASDIAAKEAQDLADSQTLLAESMQEVEEKNTTLTKNLQTLQTVMNDTTLTYEEQLSKINEICEAYGIQANMLDLLSGNYKNLEQSVTSAALAELEGQEATAKRNLSQSTINARTASNKDNGPEWYESAWHEVKSFVGNAADLFLIGSLISNATGGSGSLASDIAGSDTTDNTRMFKDANSKVTYIP